MNPAEIMADVEKLKQAATDEIETLIEQRNGALNNVVALASQFKQLRREKEKLQAENEKLQARIKELEAQDAQSAALPKSNGHDAHAEQMSA